MTDYTLGNEPTSLGDGYVITAPGVRGTVRISDRDALPREFGDRFDALLLAAGLRREKVIELDLSLTPTSRGLRSVAVDPTVLEVPRQPDTGALLLLENEDGAVSWHLPERPMGEDRGFGQEGGGSDKLRFVIPSQAALGRSAARGLGDIGKKLLKVFVYPITDSVLGAIGKGFVRMWEGKNRPYGIRSYSPTDYRAAAPDLSPAEWQRIAQDRALLFVHGTFSTAGAFSPIDLPSMTTLANAYGGRVFAFNHPTLSDDPQENADRFLSQIPPGLNLDVDIVCHSRGGLVSRELALRGASRGLKVGKIVLVGVPNGGTALADDDHMVEMIDRFTNIARVIPAGTVSEVIDALVTGLKVIAHGFLHDLTGLRAMKPNGEFLNDLNLLTAQGVELYAIASDYEPIDQRLISGARIANTVLDAVFEKAPNDLVVPTDGVFAPTNGATPATVCPGFPIPETKRVVFGHGDGVIHTEYFSNATTVKSLCDWLAPGVSAPRTIARTRGGLTVSDLAELRPHVVNLSNGSFNRSGHFDTTSRDVDEIFTTHLPKWFAEHPNNTKRIVFWAHGGLVSESDGLGVARKHVDWWKRNGVYPIYFIWETGLFDALRSILQTVAAKVPGVGARDIWDYTTDPVIEAGARALGGAKIWSAMKTNAAMCSAANGGATYVAQQLARFCRSTGTPVEVHTVGHSAGSSFHSYFIPTLRTAGITTVKSLQLLAPAIRVESFKQTIGPLIGNGIDSLTMYTMRDRWEKADNCIGVYHKSLLYLIHHALEPVSRAPILGLDITVEADADLRSLFGLDGRSGAKGNVVWSMTETTNGNASSRSSSHGGFDDDAATMNSVAARVLGVSSVPVPYATDSSRELSWPESTDWMRGVDVSALRPVHHHPKQKVQTQTLAQIEPTIVESAVMQPVTIRTGRRIALCVGIDNYPEPNRLGGCVNDSVAWQQALERLGFSVTMLHNEQATHAGVTRELQRLVNSATAGDVIVFQYAGHGYQLRDPDGDDSDGWDEALVPIDFDAGAFLVDDEIRETLLTMRTGVSLTCFLDCCHSGTATRLLMTNATGDTTGKARVLVTDPRKRRELWEKHQAFAAERSSRAIVRDIVDDSSKIRWVSFAACRDRESALEHEGHGDFTKLATKIINNGIDGLKVRDFLDRVLDAFGEDRQQTPELDCLKGLETTQLLGVADATRSVAAGRVPSALSTLAIAASLREHAERLERAHGED